jgi:hypothetical protein
MFCGLSFFAGFTVLHHPNVLGACVVLPAEGEMNCETNATNTGCLCCHMPRVTALILAMRTPHTRSHCLARKC